mgnify:CR=1 FL=1
MLTIEDTTIRPAIPQDKAPLYHLMTTDLAWLQYNGPYFPYTAPSFEAFEAGTFKHLTRGLRGMVIEHKGDPVGTVTYYWESDATRWLEVGILIYDSTRWGMGVGRRALRLWITHLFENLNVERVGFTTWSGNPGMIACGLALGMTLEGHMRKTRYHNGVYYDSVRMGVLRDEWLGAPADTLVFTRTDTRTAYTFNRAKDQDGLFVRVDRPDIRLAYLDNGQWWVLGADDQILSWCLSTPDHAQDTPPLGSLWRSRKGHKSYFYTLDRPQPPSPEQSDP